MGLMHALSVGLLTALGGAAWLMLAMNVLTGLLALLTAEQSAMLDNVTTVLLMAPVTLAITKRLELNPTVFLVTEALASNIGGTATLVGDPPNIMIASKAELGYLDFLLVLAPIAAVLMAVFLGLLIGGKLFGLLGVILAVPTIAVAKVFVKFILELYKGSHFYHAGDIAPHEAPSEVLEERLAEAADSVLAEQVSTESGEELLAPAAKEDDPRAREEAKKL